MDSEHFRSDHSDNVGTILANIVILYSIIVSIVLYSIL